MHVYVTNTCSRNIFYFKFEHYFRHIFSKRAIYLIDYLTQNHDTDR